MQSGWMPNHIAEGWERPNICFWCNCLYLHSRKIRFEIISNFLTPVSY